MVNVAKSYREAFSWQYRDSQKIRIRLPIIDPLAADNVSLSANNNIYYSNINEIQYDNLPKQSYATLEPNRWKCDGSQIIPPEENSGEQLIWEGYVSATQSDQSGNMQEQIQTIASWRSPRSFPAITLYFDITTEEYATEIEIIAYRSGVEILRYTDHPNKFIYESIPPRNENRRGFERVDQITLQIKSTSKPRHRARLQHVIFGYVLTIENDEIMDLNIYDECDPISRRLPIKTANFTLLDHDGIYNEDNPDGIWQDIEEIIPIDIDGGVMVSRGIDWEYAYENFDWNTARENSWYEWYEGETYQWINLGRFYLNSKPSTEQRNSTFKAYSTIDLLANDYYKGIYKTQTLYDIALDVLQDSGIPKLDDGSDPWFLWDGLKDITTNAVCPILPGSNILRLIAMAGCCTFKCDRNGVVRIEPIPNIQHKEYINFDTLKGGFANVTTSSDVGSVECLIYKYIKNDEIVEIVNDEFDAIANIQMRIDFNGMYTDVKIETESNENIIYAQACDITFATSGKKNIRITGKKIDALNTSVTEYQEDARDTAIHDVESNQLITNIENARNVASWYNNYLQNRKTYSSQYTVYPWIDTTDLIKAQGRFIEDAPGYVLKHSITFNGAFGGDITMKRVDDK